MPVFLLVHTVYGRFLLYASVYNYSARDRGVEYYDERVCVCLSVRDHIFGTTSPIFTKFSMHVTCGRGSVLLWWRSDTLCTSCFMDDVIFAHGCSTSPPSWSAVHMQPWAWLETVRSNTSCRPTDARDYYSGFRALKVTFQVATPGAESAVYDSLVICWNCGLRRWGQVVTARSRKDESILWIYV